MATLRLRFVTCSNLASSTIRAAQLGWPYTHVDVVVPGGYLGARLAGGVAVRPIGYDAGAGTRERFFTVAVDEAAAEAFHAYLAAQVGKPYDLAAIADFAKAVLYHSDRERAPGAWLEPDRWFCSELAAAALIHAGILAGLAAEARQVTPQNLAFALSAIAAPAASLES